MQAFARYELERVERPELTLDKDDVGVREVFLVLDLDQRSDRTLSRVIPIMVGDANKVTGLNKLLLIPLTKLDQRASLPGLRRACT